MKKIYKHIFNGFNAPVVRLDCGQKCSHLNGGSPVCCDVDNAVPIMDKSEFKLLRARSDLWRKYKPETEQGKALANSLHKDCIAAECKGAQFCERDNRSLSCRAFPFFPYIDKHGEFLGLATYWTFEDRCWVISNMKKVTAEFIEEFFETYTYLFKQKPDEYQVFKDYSATMRRVFSRWQRPIHIIARDNTFLAIQPKGAGMHPVRKRDLPKFGPYAD